MRQGTGKKTETPFEKRMDQVPAWMTKGMGGMVPESSSSRSLMNHRDYSSLIAVQSKLVELRWMLVRQMDEAPYSGIRTIKSNVESLIEEVHLAMDRESRNR